MAVFPTPITKETFPSAWKIMSGKYRWAKKKSKIRSVAMTVGQLLYFPAFLVLMLGALCTLTPRSVTSLIEKVPFLVTLWNRLAGLLFAGVDTLGQLLLRAALMLYGVPLAAFFLIALIIILVYHPRAPKLSGNDRQDAQTLWSLARHARNFSRENEKDINGFLGIFTGIVATAAVVSVIIYWVSDPAGRELAAQQSLATNLKLFALALILIFSYNIINLPLAFLMKFFCICHLSKQQAAATEIYARSFRADIPGGAAAPEQEIPAPEEPAAPVPTEEPPAGQ